MSDASLYRLMAWLSPSFPVGAYTYSHGLEWAVEDELVADEAGLRTWIDGVLRFGAGRVDGVLFVQAWKTAHDPEAFGEIATLGDTLRGTSEMALEASAQGKAFLDGVKAAWPHPGLEPHEHLSYPVAVALAAALAGIPLRPALSAFLHAFAANLVSAGVRIIPLGQTAGLRCTAALETSVTKATETALTTPIDAIGSAAPMIDWCSMKHETQYTRLFRS